MKQNTKKTIWFRAKISSLSNIFSRFTGWYSSIIKDTANNWYHLIYTLKHFKQSTIELGIYHLKQGNINDAIMRFMIVRKFCEPENDIVNYWLGISYYIKDNLPKALYYLAKTNSKNAQELTTMIKNIDGLDSIPPSILLTYRDATAIKRMTFWDDAAFNIPEILIHNICDVLEELPQDCNFLDIGSGFGEIGIAINNKTSEAYHLRGVDDVPIMLETLKHYHKDNKPLYDDVINQSVREFLINKSSSKYTAIISCDSLNFEKNLSNSFQEIHSLLKKDGYFALALQTSTQTRFLSSKNIFTYAKDSVMNQLNLAEFEILIIKDIDLDKYETYTLFICKPR